MFSHQTADVLHTITVSPMNVWQTNHRLLIEQRDDLMVPKHGTNELTQEQAARLTTAAYVLLQEHQVRRYVGDQRFIAVSEGPEDLEVLNAAIILEPGEFIEIRMLTDDLSMFLDGDPDAGTTRSGFNNIDRAHFRGFIGEVGPEVAIVLVKAPRPGHHRRCPRGIVVDRPGAGTWAVSPDRVGVPQSRLRPDQARPLQADAHHISHPPRGCGGVSRGG